MNEYSFLADVLNKFSQFTPMIQATIAIGVCAVLLGIAYFVKETVSVMVSPMHKRKPNHAAEESKD